MDPVSLQQGKAMDVHSCISQPDIFEYKEINSPFLGNDCSQLIFNVRTKIYLV